MRKTAVVAAIVLAGVGVGGTAFAGEVDGNGTETPIKGHIALFDLQLLRPGRRQPGRHRRARAAPAELGPDPQGRQGLPDLDRGEPRCGLPGQRLPRGLTLKQTPKAVPSRKEGAAFRR